MQQSITKDHRSPTDEPARTSGDPAPFADGRWRRVRDLENLAVEHAAITENPVFGLCRVRDRKIVWLNRCIEEMTGYAARELVGRTTMRLYCSRSEYIGFGKQAYPALRSGGTFAGEVQFRRKDGFRFWTRLVGRLIAAPAHGAPDALWIVEDIDSEKRATAALEDRQRRLRDLLHNTGDWIWETDADAVFTYSNGVVEDILGYRAQEVEGRTPFELMSPQAAKAALAADIATRAVAQEAWSVEDTLLHRDGHAVILESRIIPVRDAKGKLIAMRGISRDITERKRAEAERERFGDRIRAGLFDTIAALAHTVEVRDPYTSGHQKRVSKLAAAIALELGLPAEAILGIQVGGLVHDIGKIHVPSEILTRPGRFSDEEMNLVRVHPRVGHDIVRHLDLPWPVAEMVLQHHERLDGSGYPDGLEGDAIVLGAQIIGVADVVEAITSHRPYRPALGIEAGLAEIVEHRGTRYAPRIVDACTRLIREKGFRFE